MEVGSSWHESRTVPLVDRPILRRSGGPDFNIGVVDWEPISDKHRRNVFGRQMDNKILTVAVEAKYKGADVWSVPERLGKSTVKSNYHVWRYTVPKR